MSVSSLKDVENMNSTAIADTTDSTRHVTTFLHSRNFEGVTECNDSTIIQNTIQMANPLILKEQSAAIKNRNYKVAVEPLSPKKSTTIPDRFISKSRTSSKLFSTGNQTRTDYLVQYAMNNISQTVPQMREIPHKPERILDAPGIVDDFYFNVLDWSSTNSMAIGLGSTVYSWNGDTGDVAVITNLDPQELNGQMVSCVKWIPNSNNICVSSNTGEMHILDTESGSRIRSLRGRNDRVSALSWNGNILSSGGHDNTIWHHDVRQKYHKIMELKAHEGEVCGLSWRSDGRVLASGGNDNLVALWDSRLSSRPTHQLVEHEAAVKALAWCPWHSNVLATGGGSADKRIHFWNTNIGSKQNTIEAEAQVTALHWNSRSNEIIAAMGYPRNSIGIWSYPNLMKQTEIKQAHERRILSATLSPDEDILATCSADENIKFWSLADCNKKRRKRNNTCPLNRVSIGRI